MKHKIRTYIMLMIAYLVLAVPFKTMQVIPGFTDIRPVMMLGPVYALFYGLPGCIIFALMNLFMDAVSGELAWSSIAGLIANFAGPFLLFYYWNKISKTRPHLRSFGNILHYSVTLIIVAVLEALIITPSVAFFYPDVDIKLFFITVVLNTALFPMFVGIPLTILIQEELGFKPIVLDRAEDSDDRGED